MSKYEGGRILKFEAKSVKMESFENWPGMYAVVSKTKKCRVRHIGSPVRGDLPSLIKMTVSSPTYSRFSLLSS